MRRRLPSSFIITFISRANKLYLACIAHTAISTIEFAFDCRLIDLELNILTYMPLTLNISENIRTQCTTSHKHMISMFRFGSNKKYESFKWHVKMFMRIV